MIYDGRQRSVVFESGVSQLTALAIPDADGDGHRDVLAGYPGSNRVEILSGVSFQSIRVLSRPRPSVEEFGRSLDLLDDYTGDGIREWGIAAQTVASNPQTGLRDGRYLIYDGATSDVYASVTPDNQTITFGTNVRRLGDVTGDQRPDLLISVHPGLVKVYPASQLVVDTDTSPTLAPAVVEVAPNPASGPTSIRYSTPAPGFVRLTVVDALGREISRLVDREEPAGDHSVIFTPSVSMVGSYFIRLETPNGTSAIPFTAIH